MDANAVAIANERLWKENPALKKRKLTQNPEDQYLRDQWWSYYREATKVSPPEAFPKKDTDTGVACCEKKLPKRYICVRSNVPPGGNPMASGHSMISLHENGKITTYGGWPDDHDDIEAAGLSNEGKSDIRKNFAGDALFDGQGRERYPYARCAMVNEVQHSLFEQKLSQSFTWGEDTNCSSWASDTYTSITGETVNAFDKDVVRDFENHNNAFLKFMALFQIRSCA